MRLTGAAARCLPEVPFAILVEGVEASYDTI